MRLNGRIAPKKPISSKANKTVTFEWCKKKQKKTQFKGGKSRFLRRNYDRPVSKKAQFVRQPSGSIERYKLKFWAKYPKNHNKKFMVLGCLGIGAPSVGASAGFHG